MKKLRLKADDLKVHSFETAPARGRAGTVHGANTGATCEPWTCDISCVETTDVQVTAPCNCPGETDPPVC